MRRFLKALLVGGGVSCIALPLAAQSFGERSGFWISAEGGVAYGKAECGTVCNSDAMLAPVGIVRLGGTPSEKVAVSLEVSYLRSVADTTAQDYALGMAVVRVYPITNEPLYLRVGAGVGRYGEERVPAEGSRWVLSGHGFSVQAGAGYEFPVASRFRIGPSVSYVAALSHKGTRNRLPTSDISAGWLRLGMSVKWR